jgi:hypothetical protein
MTDQTTGLLGTLLALSGRTTEEHIQYGAKSQVLVPLLQMLGLVAAIGVVAGGIGCMARSLIAIIRTLTGTVDQLVASVVIGVVGLVVFSIARDVFRHVGWDSRVWRPLAEFGLATSVTLLVIGLLRALADDWIILDSAFLFGGLALVVGGSLLIWRFGNELWNPLFPRPPIVEAAMQMIDRLYPDAKQVRVLDPYPIRLNGKDRAVEAAEHLTSAPDDQDEATDINPAFTDLIEFLQLASLYGLARDGSDKAPGLVRHPHHILPSGRKLTRAYYGDLMDMAARWRLVNPGGGGHAATWRMEPDDAIEFMRNVMAQMGQAT